MLRINQLKLPTSHTSEDLEKKVRKTLGLRPGDSLDFQIAKRSIDARKKPELFYVYTIDCSVSDEKFVLKRASKNGVTVANPVKYSFPVSGKKKLENRPIVVGLGPAGLFCAYFLAKHGYCPIILERGKDVDSRLCDVQKFWDTGILDTQSNVQFGEGGAGTFSDGKLNTLIKDKTGKSRAVLELFHRFGAPESILIDAKPHVGTDILKQIVKAMREEIIALGGQVYFEHTLTDCHFSDGALHSVSVFDRKNNQVKTFDCSALILAIGHSARDTFSMLHKHAILMEAKDFAVGFRVEHLQSQIDYAQYGTYERGTLPTSAYKVTYHAKNDRNVYSFCMCPGGYVVNASSEEGRLAINGMSYSKRDGIHANSAIIMNVTRKDYPDETPLAGVAFQRELEKRAFDAAGGAVPYMTLKNFKEKFEDENADIREGNCKPCVKGTVQNADITKILPASLNEAFLEAMEYWDRIIPGFNDDDVIIEAVESRTSSPVRIVRDDETLQSSIRGIYPCGEGAGYAGGIMSAAMDGIRIAEAIAGDYSPIEEQMR